MDELSNTDSASNELIDDHHVAISPQQLIETLREEYDRADRIAKEVEEFEDQVGLPAHNELRYAGFHAIVALYEGDVGQRVDQLRSAVGHARRASYEAGEAGITAALDQVAMFDRDYQHVVVSDVVQDWTAIQVRCDEIRELIADARQTGPDRSNDHKVYIELFHELQGVCQRLRYSRNDLNKRIRDRQDSSRKWLLGTIVALLGLVLTVVFGLSG